MNKYKIIVLSLLFLSSLLLPTACSSKNKNTDPPGPTATVIDDETGEPIEGAIAIAIWRKNSIKAVAWFEGGKEVPVRIEEVFSDKGGRLFIKGFWNWHLFKMEYPRLTIYKFGYVCWDQQRIFHPKSSWEDRKDFNRDNRIVRLKKWPEDMSFEKHSSFMSNVTHGDYSRSKDHLLIKAFGSEDNYLIQENIKNYPPKKN
jgi:hypothetical protein